jgi:hypothetical protein
VRHLDLDRLQQQLWPHGSNRDVWMIVDAARDQKIYWYLTNSHLETSCLYSGDIPVQLEAVAPYLVQLEFDDSSTRDLLLRSWGHSWGVFLTCDASLKRLRRHLRTLLIVQDWRGKQLLFRYYDPRVLRAYVPTCTSDELKTLFGPVKQFSTESQSAERLLTFDFSRGSLLKSETEVSVSQAKMAARTK